MPCQTLHAQDWTGAYDPWGSVFLDVALGGASAMACMKEDVARLMIGEDGAAESL